jgi:hypothetical protein
VRLSTRSTRPGLYLPATWYDASFCCTKAFEGARRAGAHLPDALPVHVALGSPAGETMRLPLNESLSRAGRSFQTAQRRLQSLHTDRRNIVGMLR